MNHYPTFCQNRASQTFKNADFVFFLPQATFRSLDLQNPPKKTINATPEQLEIMNLNFD